MQPTEKTTDRILRHRYIAALSIIACLVIFSQLAIQVSISKNEDDSRIINIAGRQRMLSQRISKCAYGIYLADIAENPAKRASYLTEMSEAVHLWDISHKGLQNGDPKLGLPGRNSSRIKEMFTQIQDRHDTILNAAKSIALLTSNRAANDEQIKQEIRKIINNESDFLTGMDKIVFQYDSEAKAKVKLVRQIEIYLMLLTLVVLALEAAFIFRPAEMKIKEKMTRIQENKSSLKALHQEFQALLNGMPDGIALLSPDWTITWVNSAMSGLMGLEPEEIIGGKCHATLRSSAIPCNNCPVQTCFDTGQPEVRLLRNSPGKTMELRAIPVKDDAGNTLKVIKVLRDVTEQKNIERQLRNSQKMETIGKLAGGIAHDFNNILSAIIGFGSLIQMKSEADTRIGHYAQQILSLADRAADLTQGLLAFSRKQVMTPRPMDVNSLVRDEQRLLQSLLGSKIVFEPQLSPAPLTVMADSVSLEQVLVNLVSNAKDAMTGGGKLIIRSEACVFDDAFEHAHGHGIPGSYASISVTDTGEGIDESIREKIFEPFFTTKEVGKGTGLGLAAVYGIIEQHGGYIKVASKPGSGTTFTIYLPLVSDAGHGNEPGYAYHEDGGNNVTIG